MKDHFLNIEKDHEILTWTLNRPERLNALGPTLAGEFSSALSDLKKNKKARVLIIKANSSPMAHGPIWIAGGDLKELCRLHDPQKVQAYIRSFTHLCDELEVIDIPVIVAIHGHAIGGGAELALSGDIRIGTKATVFDFRQLKVGLATGYGGTERLVRLVGKAQAQRLLYLSEKIDAQQALHFGLLHDVVETEQQLIRKSFETAKQLKGIFAPAFALQKKFINTAFQKSDRNKEIQSFCNLWGNEVHKSVLKKYLRGPAPRPV